MSKDTLESKEPHPAVYTASKYVTKILNEQDSSLIIESFASCAIENNRLAEICLGTIKRIKAKEPVSDRYLLGLAWALKDMEDTEKRLISRHMKKDGSENPHQIRKMK